MNAVQLAAIEKLFDTLGALVETLETDAQLAAIKDVQAAMHTLNDSLNPVQRARLTLVP